MKNTVGAWILRVVALLQIVGGMLGIWEAMNALLSRPRIGAVLVIISFSAAFAFGIVAGVLLLLDKNRGYELSRIFQVFQLPLLHSPIFSYKFGVGYFAHLIFVGDDIVVETATELGSHWVFVIGSGQPFHLGINIVALGAVVLLNKQMAALKEVDAKVELNDA